MSHLQLDYEKYGTPDQFLTTLNIEYKDKGQEVSLESFLDKIDLAYKGKIDQISMFDTSQTCQWTVKKKQLFACLFYHARGHFCKFLWLIGSRSKSLETKEKVLENIKEEFGEDVSNPSHEQMYLEFAKDVGVNLEKEIYEEEYYLQFLKEFDKGHIKSIVNTNSEEELVALLSAYERLDNIDYKNLLSLAKSIGVTDQKALLFFVVHSNASHFNRLEEILKKIWETNSQIIIDAFQFIYSHQISLWEKLSETIEMVNFE